MKQLAPDSFYRRDRRHPDLWATLWTALGVVGWIGFFWFAFCGLRAFLNWWRFR